MQRSTTEGGGEPLVRSLTFPLLAGYWSFGQFWGVADLRAAMAVIVLATVGITATGLFARERTRT